MWPWYLFFLALLGGIYLLAEELRFFTSGIGIGSEKAALTKVCALLQEFEETFGAGLVPEQKRWEGLSKLPYPWGNLANESLQELRKSGAALVPTLRRLRALAHGHGVALADARARAAQALVQAMACAVMIPLFGIGLYILMPGVSENRGKWMVACCVALMSGVMGALWMLQIAEKARWAGLPRASRPWVLAAQCAGERFLALVRAGTPADLAWVRACDLLRTEAPLLGLRWGRSIWTEGEGAASLGKASTHSETSLIEAGVALRKAVQVSLMEGRPCTERAETALLALSQEMRAHVERELSVLPAHALKPLFFCVAPALMGMMAFGLWLGWSSIVGGNLGDYFG